jgi:intraflagellar transport protein 80
MFHLRSYTLAIIDRTTSQTVKFLDTSAGKAVGEEVTHALEIADVCLNQTGSTPDRKLVFIDRNRDLYITPVLKVWRCMLTVTKLLLKVPMLKGGAG